MKPSYDPHTLAHYFSPISEETLGDPVLAPIFHRLAREDPDILAAVADIDRSLIRDFLALSAGERLRYSITRARWAERAKHG